VSGNNGGGDAWVVKLTSTGAIQWQKTLGGTDSDGANSIQQTTDGGYIVAGTTNSNDGDVSGNHGAYPTSDFWVVKLDSLGTIQWQKTLGGTGGETAYSIQQTADGGYIVAGNTKGSNDGDVSGNNGDLDAWVVKLTSTGNIQWQKALGGTGIDGATSIQQTMDGGYIVAAGTASNDGDVFGYHGGSGDSWVVKLDSLGTIIWQKTLGGTRGEIVYSIQQTMDGGYVMAGITYSNDGDVSGHYFPTTLADIWVVKLGPLTDIEDIQSTENLKIYPNPFSTSTTIQTDHLISSYRIYNISGRLVSEERNLSGRSVTVKRGGLRSGMYFIEVLSDDGVLGREKVIIQ